VGHHRLPVGRQLYVAGLLGLDRHCADSGCGGRKLIQIPSGPGLIPDSLDPVPVKKVAGPLPGGIRAVANRLSGGSGGLAQCSSRGPLSALWPGH
jgi:hypothetical protein